MSTETMFIEEPFLSCTFRTTRANTLKWVSETVDMTFYFDPEAGNWYYYRETFCTDKVYCPDGVAFDAFAADTLIQEVRRLDQREWCILGKYEKKYAKLGKFLEDAHHKLSDN